MTCLSGILPIPPDLDEMMFAGFLRRDNVEMVACETSPLEVPANSEIDDIEDAASVPVEVGNMPLVALVPQPLPTVETTDDPALPESGVTAVKWHQAARRARLNALPRRLAAWLVTIVIIVAVLGVATVTLIGWERSLAVALAARHHAGVLIH